MARKTIDIETLRISANQALVTEAEGNTPQFRNGVAGLLESALMSTGNYKGFRFTDGNNGRTDHTRRVYY
jgi:hypothetical protein